MFIAFLDFLILICYSALSVFFLKADFDAKLLKLISYIIHLAFLATFHIKDISIDVTQSLKKIACYLTNLLFSSACS